MKIFIQKFLPLILILADGADPTPVKAQTQGVPRPSPVALHTAPNELGKPFITNWLPKDYGANAQNWAIAQDDRGVMYFGNSEGVLEYDGVSWRLLKYGNVSFTRALAIADDGKLYVGGKGELGYFAPVHETAKDGRAQNPFKRQFVSLLQYLQPEDREFTDVWEIAISSQGVFFQAYERLFQYIPPPHSAPPATAASSVGRAGAEAVSNDEDSPLAGHMQAWKPKTKFDGVAAVYGRIYVSQSGIGLMQVQGDSLALVPGGENIGGSIEFMAPFSDREGQEKILIATRNHALFWYDTAGCRPLEAEAVSFFKELVIYTGAVLPDGTVALATHGGGAVIFDPAGSGSVRQVLDKTSGLKNDTVLDLFCDRQGGLWLALNNGIARMEMPAPLTFYDETSGLHGGSNAIIRHQNTLYVATDIGVFYLRPSSGIFSENAPDDGRGTFHVQPEFRPVAGLQEWSWAFLIMAETGELLAGGENGLYRIRGDRAELLTSFGHDIVSLHHSRRDRNRIYAGLRYGGLATVRRAPNGSWINEGKIASLDDEYIRNITESEDGSLWLTAKYKNYLIRVVFPPASSSSESKDLLKPEIQRYGAAQGLPEGVTIYTAVIAGQLYAHPRGSVFRFEPQRGTFIPDSSILANADTSTYIEKMIEDKWGNVWLDFNEILYRARPREGGGYDTDSTPFRRIDRQPFYAIYPDENGVVWFADADGLGRYDSRVAKNYAADFPALIRRVIAGVDSVIFDGLPIDKAEVEPSLPYAHNALRFECAASSYDNLAANQYQYFLEGFDKSWSAWTKESKKDYTNLPHGRLRFHVRAKNIYGHLSREGMYAFAILPPWWRTWWAYGGYALMLGLLVFAVDRVQRRRFSKKSASGRKFAKPNCARRRLKQRTKRCRRKMIARKTSSCSAKSAKKSLLRWTWTRFFTSFMSALNNWQTLTASASAFTIRKKSKSNIASPLKKANAMRRTPATPATRISFRFGALRIANRFLSMT
jgi:hypothetical protein